MTLHMGSITAQWLNPPAATPALCTETSVWVLAALLLLHLPSTVPEKAAEGGPIAEDSATQVGDLDGDLE